MSALGLRRDVSAHAYPRQIFQRLSRFDAELIDSEKRKYDDLWLIAQNRPQRAGDALVHRAEASAMAPEPCRTKMILHLLTARQLMKAPSGRDRRRP